MAKFVINGAYNDRREVVADNFIEKDSLVIFTTNAGKDKVFAIPTSRVQTIERVEE